MGSFVSPFFRIGVFMNKIKRFLTILSLVLSVAMVFSYISVSLVNEDIYKNFQESITRPPEQKEFGGKTIASYDFSEDLVFNSRYDYEDYPGVFNEGSIKYGSINTNNGRFEFRSDEAGVYDSPYFGFYLKDTQTSKSDGLRLDSCDYITIDYNMSTSTGYIFDNCQLSLDVRNSDLSFAKGRSRLQMFNIDAYQGLYKINSFEGQEMTLDDTDVNHFTWVIYINHEDISSSWALIYVNGYYAFTFTNIFISESCSIASFRFDRSDKYATEGWAESICFDNFTVNVFGEGSGSYNGAISSLFEDSSITLDDCIDSILYSGN